MAKINLSPSPKPFKASGFSLPKMPMARPPSASSQTRTTASAYGKLAKMGSKTTTVPIQEAD